MLPPGVFGLNLSHNYTQAVKQTYSGGEMKAPGRTGLDLTYTFKQKKLNYEKIAIAWFFGYCRFVLL
jgi:hypothetical protein